MSRTMLALMMCAWTGLGSVSGSVSGSGLRLGLGLGLGVDNVCLDACLANFTRGDQHCVGELVSYPDPLLGNAQRIHDH